MFKDFSHSNSLKLLIWFISFSTRQYNCRLFSSIFLLLFFSLSYLTFFVTWFCYLHRFSIHIPNSLLWLLTFNCSLFSRLLIFFSFSANFVSSLVIEFFGKFLEVPPYTGLLLHSGKVEKCSFLTHDFASLLQVNFFLR